MPRCIAFLRGFNVGGRFIRMQALRATLERALPTRATFRNVSTLRKLVAKFSCF